MRTSLNVLVSVALLAAGSAVAAGAEDVVIRYPRDRSVVGAKVNVVLDYAADWTEIPFIQVRAGDREYPAVATSSGRHAVQGVELRPGLNTLTVRYFAFDDPKGKKGRKLAASREISVYSHVPLLSGSMIPAGFTIQPFHSREQESECSGCHRMDAGPTDRNPAKFEDVLCASCHKGIPTGRHIHGPAALGGCLFCHDADAGPVKYRFAERSPWKITRTTQPVEPLVFSIPAGGIFKPSSASLAMKRKQVKALLAPSFKALREHRAYRMLLEVHTDGRPVRNPRYKNHRRLAEARARVLANLFVELGAKKSIITAAGGRAPAGKGDMKSRERIMVVLHPRGVDVKNSASLPSLKGWERQVVHIAYANGPALSGLELTERLPAGVSYVQDTGTLQGRIREPRLNKDRLVWQLGSRQGNFEETIVYLVRRKEQSGAPESSVSYTQKGDSAVMTFAPRQKGKKARTMAEACLACHPALLDGPFMHGPAEAGYCTYCHDPHASPNPAWLRTPVQALCTTCHAGMAEGRHVVAGFVSGKTHPLEGRRDPARPGRELSCASCHSAHSSPSRSLFAYGVKERYELCGLCHKNY